MARQTIRTLAAEMMRRFPELQAIVTQGHCNTDRKIGRLRRPGGGRRGSLVTVTKGTQVIFQHNNAETYRHTGEVRDWIERYARSRHAPGR